MNHKEVLKTYTDHIPNEKRVFPPHYLDSTGNITEGDFYDVKSIKSNPRRIINEDYTRIGDSVFVIPPQSIDVNTISSNQAYTSIRQKSHTLSKAGYEIKTIKISLIINGYEQLNGFEIPGPDKTLFVDGLRPLIAQFRKMPFLPVENFKLNVIHDIHCITLLNMSVNVNQNNPELFRVTIEAEECNIQPFISSPDCVLSDMFDWDLFRWYYNRSMQKIDEEYLYLKKFNPAFKDDIVFGIIDEKLLTGIKTAGPNEDDYNIIDYNMIDRKVPDDVILQEQSLGIGNIIKRLQLSDHRTASHQYFGGTTTYISCKFVTQNPISAQFFKDIQENATYLARTYRNRMVNGFMGFHSELSRLFGVRHIMMESLNINVNQDMPGVYTIDCIMSSYDKTQRLANTPQGFSPVYGKGKIDDLLSNRNQSKFRGAYYDQVIENMLNKINLYPDLELPTYNEVNKQLTKIRSWRQKNNLSLPKYTKLSIPDKLSNDSIVDPDFYIWYPSPHEIEFIQNIEDEENFKKVSKKVEASMKASMTPWNRERLNDVLYEQVSSQTASTPSGSSPSTGGGQTGPRKGGNPSYHTIIKYIEELCGTDKKLTQIAKATAWTESKMTQWNDNGTPFVSADNDTGIMQIVFSAKSGNWIGWKEDGYDETRGRNDWKYNIWAGIEILKKYRNQAKNESNIARGTYSGYNGNVVSRYRTTTDQRDLNFWNHYQNSPWKSFDEGKSANEETSYYNEKAISTGSSNFFKPLSVKWTYSPNGHFGAYRYNKLKGYAYKHKGIDLWSNRGDIVYSSTNGKVLYAGYDIRAGNFIKIQSTDNSTVVTRYLHLDTMKVKTGNIVIAGQAIGTEGDTGNPDDGEYHLHYEIILNGTPVDPKPYLEGTKQLYGNSINDPFPVAGSITDTGQFFSNRSKETLKFSGIDMKNFGKPLKGKVGSAAFNNSEKGLTERMAVDMMTYNRRGRMLRAFPTYLILFIDEGIWLDGRRLWSNFYSYNSAVDITVEKDKHKPVDVATVRLLNIYNSLGTNPKVFYGERSWYNKISEMLQWYNDDILNQMVKNKNALLKSFNIQPGARMHIRMGYGNCIDKLPIVFNGTIAEVDTQDVVTVIAQSDGAELLNSPVGTAARDEITTTFNIGHEPQNIIYHILSKRSNSFLYGISGGKIGESSKYGIEHFGQLYYRNYHDEFLDYYNIKIRDIILTGAITGVAGPAAGAAYATGTILTPMLNATKHKNNDNIGRTFSDIIQIFAAKVLNVSFESWFLGVDYEDYDLMKNIYLGNEELAKTNKGEETKNWWTKLESSKEKNLAIYVYNRTPWDICQTLAYAVPEFICYPHHHQFRSTLFYGIPYWNVRYKYKYVNEKTVYEYAKPYMQMHMINSHYDILDNQVKAVKPHMTNSIGLYYDNGEGQQAIDKVYADNYIRGDLQTTKIVDTGTSWHLTGIGFVDSVLDTIGVDKFLQAIFNYNPARDNARRIAVATLQDAFKDMYQGNLVILGDASIKPHDFININDTYTTMSGSSGVGQVVHHMGMETGFVTTIKPDLVTMQSDVNTMYLHCIRFGLAFGISLAIVTKGLRVSKSALATFRGIKLASIGLKITDIRHGFAAAKGLQKIMTGVRLIGGGWKSVKTALIALPNAAPGVGTVVSAIMAVILFATEAMFTKILNYIRDANVIKIYPLWVGNKPYIAGITGHKNLIPGYTDADIQINQKSDVTNSIATTVMLKQASVEFFDVETKNDITKKLIDKEVELVDKSMNTLLLELYGRRDYKSYLNKQRVNGNNYDKDVMALYKDNIFKIITGNIENEPAYPNLKGKVFRPVPYAWGEKEVKNVIGISKGYKQAITWGGYLLATRGTKGSTPYAMYAVSSPGLDTYVHQTQDGDIIEDFVSDWVANLLNDQAGQETPVCSALDGRVVTATIHHDILHEKEEKNPVKSVIDGFEDLIDRIDDSWRNIMGTQNYTCRVVINSKLNVNGELRDILITYMNMCTICVTTGDNIKAGDTIGTIGYVAAHSQINQIPGVVGPSWPGMKNKSSYKNAKKRIDSDNYDSNLNKLFQSGNSAALVIFLTDVQTKDYIQPTMLWKLKALGTGSAFKPGRS